MRFLGQVWVILSKDLRAELRSKEAINASLSFSVVILLLFSFAFDPTDEQTRAIAGGLLWIVFAFAGAMILNRSFAREIPNDCLDALIAAPVSGAALFLGKALANFLLLIAIELVCLPVFGVFYNVRWAVQFWPMFGVLALGTWGLTVIGTIFSALTVNIRLRELMLPLMTYPMTIPALMSAMQMTAVLMAGQPLTAEHEIWFRILVVFDVIYTSLALFMMETVLVG